MVGARQAGINIAVQYLVPRQREALVLPDPESFLGEVPASMEYRGGQLYTPDQAEPPEPVESPASPESPPATTPAEQLPQ